jgi:hypothetical protein
MQFGYVGILRLSFPDADMHFKYLLKRVQVNSSPIGTDNETID